MQDIVAKKKYEMLKNKGIIGYVKYSYFHKEQKKPFQKDSFLIQNLFYHSQEDFYVYAMGQRIENIGLGIRISSN